MDEGRFHPASAQCWAFPRAVLGVTGGRWDGGRFLFVLFCFVSFLYIYHILLSSWHLQLLGVAASWAVWDSPSHGMCTRMIPMGYCCHLTWLCHPMGGDPFLQWQVVTDTHLLFQAGPASQFMRQGLEGVRQGWIWPEQRAGISTASWPLFQPRPCPDEGCHCACPCQSTSALSLCAPCLISI